MSEQLERPRRAKGEPIESWNERREAYVAHWRRIRSTRPHVVQVVDNSQTVVNPVEMDADARRRLDQAEEVLAWATAQLPFATGEVAAPPPDPRIVELEAALATANERAASATDESERLRGALEACIAQTARQAEQLAAGAKDNGGPGEMEYGAPAEVVTEVEPEPASDHRQRLIASDWMRSQMKPGESLAQARNRLLQEYNDLLNRNVTASFANDAERIRFRDLTANMTDFSKG